VHLLASYFHYLLHLLFAQSVYIIELEIVSCYNFSLRRLLPLLLEARLLLDNRLLISPWLVGSPFLFENTHHIAHLLLALTADLHQATPVYDACYSFCRS
jgi:hypothetical protein